jgi:hemerythrin superfamily protein
MARTRRKPDVVDLLKRDHREVEALFREFEQLADDHDAAAQAIENACIELKMHHRIETEIFYPAIREAAQREETEDLLDEAEIEHDTVRELIEKLEGMDPSDEKRHAHFKVLTEYVKHHVREEEKEIFPQVKKLKALDHEALCVEMKARRHALMTEMGIEEDAREIA